MESARRARLDDGERIADLRSQAHRSVVGVRGGAMLIAEQAATEVAWSTRLNDPRRLSVVGTLEGHVVGYGLAKLESFAALGPVGPIGVVEEVWVEAEARGVGVGEAVMASIRAWCLASGCLGMDAAALPGDRVMKGFFERFGMSARLLVMHHRFTDADTAS